MSSPRITVVGSANIDLVARCERLPQAGETVGDAKGARGDLFGDLVAIGALGTQIRAHPPIRGVI